MSVRTLASPSFDGVRGRLRRIHAELNEDRSIFDHRSQRTNKPRQISINILPLDRVAENACALRCIAHQCQNEEEKCKSLRNVSNYS
jgi:hypothetical protein